MGCVLRLAVRQTQNANGTKNMFLVPSAQFDVIVAFGRYETGNLVFISSTQIVFDEKKAIRSEYLAGSSAFIV